MHRKYSSKDTLFCRQVTLNCRGRVLVLDGPVVMGILNLTPDSFYDGGQLPDADTLLARAHKMISEGATILDVGGASSRPGASAVSVDEEQARVLPAIALIKKYFPDTFISIDTVHATVAEAAAQAGADIINDISAGTADERMLATAARMQMPFIMMHMQGTPQTMAKDPQFENVTEEVINFFIERVQAARSAGINDIIIDPGFGFGKTVDHNYMLMESLTRFQIFDLLVMVGISRKSMINKVLGTTPAEALNGTTILNTLALQKGAAILRVHDVKEALEAIHIVKYMQKV